MHEIDLQKHQRREARWRILLTLDTGRPIPQPETMLHQVLHEISLPISPHQIRRELKYLENKGLVRLKNTKEPTWMAELTSEGIDVVEYEAAAPVGISRPDKWW